MAVAAAAAAEEEEQSRQHSGRKFKAKCWMAESFPISLQQLLPILDVIGEANKHLKKVLPCRMLHICACRPRFIADLSSFTMCANGAVLLPVTHGR